MATPAKRREELPWLHAGLGLALSLADDADFLRLLWSLNALQTGRADVASRFLRGYPPAAVGEGIIGKAAIYPWELETLANELLTTPKHQYYRTFNCRAWDEARAVVNQLRLIENAEYGARRESLNILVEMGRIGARQFPWQRGHFGIPQLYRSAFVYGQGECASYLQKAYGLSAFDMTLVGFSLLSVFYPEPAIRPASNLDLIHEFGIDRDTLARALGRIARPLADVQREAVSLRNVDSITPYKPSILRQFPCILLGHRNRAMMAPLPDLIMDRVTSGLFYDVVGGGRAVREEIGRRFEAYSLALLDKMLTLTRFAPETLYRTRLGQIATPDILMFDQEGAVQLAIECKAVRMSVTAKFGETPAEDRGYEEIAKGVMQLWRFVAHCRQKTAPHHLASEPQAMLLTMDEWFAGRSTVIPEIIKRAHEIADAGAHVIAQEDRRPVAFCTISELEVALRTATAASLCETVRIASGDKVGWIFSILHEETGADKTEPKLYPFEEALGELLPWYAKIGTLRAARKGAAPRTDR